MLVHMMVKHIIIPVQLYFEENHNWTGINIEPIPEIHNKLIINRPKCINLNIAVDENNGICEFCCNDMLSGIKSHYDPRHINRINNEYEHYDYSNKVITVQTKRLDDIFRENNIKRVHYLSIDVEGAELQVIKLSNFDEVFIDVIPFITVLFYCIVSFAFVGYSLDVKIESEADEKAYWLLVDEWKIQYLLNFGDIEKTLPKPRFS